MYPDFLGIGAQKAGTTWLSRNLQPHPQIWMPRIKELHYFDGVANARNGPLRRLFGPRLVNRRWRRQVKERILTHSRKPDRGSLAWDLRYYLMPPGDRWYAALFRPEEGQVCGEITPAYSTLGPEAVAHAHGLMPDAKILFFMRNPVERAWSQAVMHFGKVEDRKIGAVAGDEVRRHFGRAGSRARTGYLRTLDDWSRFYPEEQIFVGFLEDVRFFPDELLRRVYGFLGVDPTFEPPALGQKVHSRSEGRMPLGLAAHLARAYREELDRLHERFGGYASFWLYCADRLIDGSPAEDPVPYPLWNSSMWQDWVGDSAEAGKTGYGRGELLSGSLSRIQASGGGER